MQADQRQAFWNWLLLSIFFAYQYLLRVYPGILADDIRATFQFSAQELSTLSTYNIYVYSLLQVPLGLLLDRVGLRWLSLSAIGLCLIGNYFLTHTDVAWVAKASRLLVGVGSAPALMSAFKAASDSFSEHRKGLYMGITFALGVLTVVVGGKWLAFANTQENWRSAVEGLQHFGYIFFFVCLLTLSTSNPKRPAYIDPFEKPRPKESFFSTFWGVVSNRKILLYGLLSIGAYSPVAAFSDLWGPGFLTTKFNLSNVQAVSINLFIYIGLGIGGVFVPMFFNYGKKLLRGIRYSCLILSLLIALLIYGPNTLSTLVLQSSLFLFGFFSCAEILCFVLATQLATEKTSGLIVGWVNTMNMLGVAFLQQAVGWYLDTHWKGHQSPNGLRAYSTSEYELSIGILLHTVLVCTVIACFMRTKKHLHGNQF